jgi:predicted Zn-dependent protease
MQPILRNFRRAGERLGERMTEAQWDAVRAAAILLVLAALGAAGYFFGWPAWKRWQNHRALAQATAFAKTGNTRSVILALRRATQLEPEDVETWRETARLLEQVNSPDEVIVRSQLLQLVPNDMNARLALAQDALKFGRYDMAEAAVAGLSPAARQDLAYHRFAATLAASLNRNDDLEKEVRAILALKPDDLDARFTYASLRLWGNDPAAVGTARAELVALLRAPTVRVRAAIQLLAEASRQGDPARVRDVLVVLLARFAPGAAPDFSAPAIPAWNTLIDAVKSAAASSPGDAVIVMRWLASMGRAPDALAWHDTLPAAVRDTGRMKDIAAELSAGQDDLERLSRLLRAGAWGDWPANAQTLALASRLQTLRFSAQRGRQTWDDAIGASGNSLVGMRALARLASIWHNPEGEERVLRDILRRNPKIYWAYGALRTLYLAHSDLGPLLDLYGAWSAELPDDPSVASARIMLGCLLNRAGPDAIARAAELRARFPASLPAQMASAAALWRGGRPAEAWSILAALPPTVLSREDIAFWTALIQADLGHGPEAIAAIRLAAPAASSQEERLLLERAAAKAGVMPPAGAGSPSRGGP